LVPPPENTGILLANAHQYYGRGEFSHARSLLLRVPAEEREGRDYLLLLGACMARMREVPEALGVFKRLLEVDPDCHEALTWMSALTRDPRDMRESLGYAERAVALRPDDPTGYGTLGAGYLSINRPEDAIRSFLRAIELAPDVAEHRHNAALAYLAVSRHHEAIAQLNRAIELAPGAAPSYVLLASTFGLFGMAGQAIDCLSRGLALMPDSAQLHSAIAGSFAMIRNDEAAERHHRRAMELSADTRGAYASWLLNQGRFEESNRLFEEMIGQGADPAFAYYGLVQGRKAVTGAFVSEMEALLKPGTLRPRSEMYLRYALGRAEEQRKRFELAIAHFDAANEIAARVNHRGGSQRVDPSTFGEEHARIQRCYESIRQLEGDPDEAPIFIVGMIRSGTTLLDQIVSSHPAVSSGGELRFWLEETRRLVLMENVTADSLQSLAQEYLGYSRLLAGDAHRVTDKMPLNFASAGIIHRALPNARFLHIRRNPVDTCLSIWTTYFGQGAIFAYGKANIVAYYREYLRMMDYWRNELPSDRLFEIDYEDLIADPETVIPGIVEFLGLPWDEACLHHDKNQSAINTPSRWQARQPIYKSSLERWRSYEPWLGEFSELLTST